ncbi:MAG TPA: hypothetical protein PKI19_07815 [Elusimicrobiales bacterium]|nr:hypothetical protein [Elusimicrobiales bacterium]
MTDVTPMDITTDIILTMIEKDRLVSVADISAALPKIHDAVLDIFDKPVIDHSSDLEEDERFEGNRGR